jgi:CRP-like cAMP-binding protein
MSHDDQSSFDNLLIRLLGPADFAAIVPSLERVWVEQDQVLARPNEPIEHVYFPESGFVSTTAITAGDGRTEVGITGREGMIGIPVLLGADRTPHETFVQAGRAVTLRIDADNFRDKVGRSASMQALLLRYVQAYIVQSSHSTVSNAHHRIEARLARWLLMCHDRSEGDEISLTHEFMSMMIAAQRTGVTLCLHVLEGAGMIRSTRGRVMILDRDRLEDLAGDAYGAPEAEYRRLLGPFGRSAQGLGELVPA